MCFFSSFRSKTWVWFWSLTNRSPHLLVLTCASHRLITFDRVSSAPLVLTVTMQKVSLFSLSCREEKLIKHWILIRTFKCRYTAHYVCSRTLWEPGVFQAPVCCHAPSLWPSALTDTMLLWLVRSLYSHRAQSFIIPLHGWVALSQQLHIHSSFTTFLTPYVPFLQAWNVPNLYSIIVWGPL